MNEYRKTFVMHFSTNCLSVWQQVLLWQHLEVFGVLKTLTSQEFKPMNGISPNLQYNFTLRGYTVYLIFVALF